MNNKAYVSVTIGDEEKLMKFDFNAIADVEEHFGKGISRVFDKETIGFRTIRALYWAGLKWKEPGLTIPRVGTMLSKELEDGATFESLMEPISEAMAAAKIFKKKDKLAKAEDEESEGDEKN
jgi:hypothetical protein